MSAYVLTDGTNVVSMNPEYDIQFDSRKIENSHRTRSGANYRYLWGAFKRVKFTVEDVTSADMCRINSWWGANTIVKLLDINSQAVINSGYLVNASAPIDKYLKPYVDSFKGVIELESC